MNANLNDHWETVSKASGYRTARLPVPGGWLYRETVIGYSEGSGETCALAFVPDPSASHVVTPCPDCEHPVSNTDDTCPNCREGLPMPDDRAHGTAPHRPTTTVDLDNYRQMAECIRAAMALLDAFDRDDPQHFVTLTIEGAAALARLRETIP